MNKRPVLVVIGLAAAVVFLSACGPPPPNKYVYANPYKAYFSNCATCLAITNPQRIMTAAKSTTSDGSIQMRLDVLTDPSNRSAVGDPSAPAPSAQAGAVNAFNDYYGRAALVGVMTLSTAAAAHMCGAPAGDYRIDPLTPSYLSQGSLTGGTYEAVGPVRIVFQLTSSQFQVVTVGSESERHLSVNALAQSVGANICNVDLLTN